MTIQPGDLVLDTVSYEIMEVEDVVPPCNDGRTLWLVSLADKGRHLRHEQEVILQP